MTPPSTDRLPGAAESAWRATASRAGTRCRMALTVVSSTAGRVAACHARQPRQRRHALRHHSGVRRRPVIRQAIPGREFEHFDVGREEARARATSIAMRAPSRQTTARLTAGALARAATARARSASTRPSAPSATPADSSGRPGVDRSAGERRVSLRCTVLVARLAFAVCMERVQLRAARRCRNPAARLRCRSTQA